METTFERDDSMDVEYVSGEDFMERPDNDNSSELRTCWNLQGMFLPSYIRKERCVTWGNQDLDEPRWEELTKHHMEVRRLKGRVRPYGARTEKAWERRVAAVYKDVEVHPCTGGKDKWEAVLVNDLVAASGPYSAGPDHYLEPLYYYGKK